MSASTVLPRRVPIWALVNPNSRLWIEREINNGLVDLEFYLVDRWIDAAIVVVDGCELSRMEIVGADRKGKPIISLAWHTPTDWHPRIMFYREHSIDGLRKLLVNATKEIH